jgi:predicted RNase H-like nuclease (RuvC/YqgF family)
MIKLIPSTGIVKVTGIDFKLVESIINCFIDIPQRLTLKVERNQASWSGYWVDSKKIKIDLSQGTSLKYVISTLLHEIRHAEQLANKRRISFDYQSYKQYYDSPEEKDARNFEKLTTDVCSIYRRFEALNTKYSTLCIRRNKELLHNSKR